MLGLPLHILLLSLLTPTAVVSSKRGLLPLVDVPNSNTTDNHQVIKLWATPDCTFDSKIDGGRVTGPQVLPYDTTFSAGTNGLPPDFSARSYQLMRNLTGAERLEFKTSSLSNKGRNPCAELVLRVELLKGADVSKGTALLSPEKEKNPEERGRCHQLREPIGCFNLTTTLQRA